MAITKMAIRSSITASAVRKIFNEKGTRSPNKDKIPMAKAISVAIGIPTPLTKPEFIFKAKKISAGIITPPNALNAGSEAFLSEESSPA